MKIQNKSLHVLMIKVAVLAVNLSIVRDVRRFEKEDFIMLFLLDLFFPFAALICGLAGIGFFKFTGAVFCFSVMYLLFQVMAIMSSM